MQKLYLNFLILKNSAFAECFSSILGKELLSRVSKNTLDKENFKSNFEAVNEFKSKSF